MFTSLRPQGRRAAILPDQYSPPPTTENGNERDVKAQVERLRRIIRGECVLAWFPVPHCMNQCRLDWVLAGLVLAGSVLAGSVPAGERLGRVARLCEVVIEQATRPPDPGGKLHVWRVGQSQDQFPTGECPAVAWCIPKRREPIAGPLGRQEAIPARSRIPDSGCGGGRPIHPDPRGQMSEATIGNAPAAAEASPNEI
jgi:hypothetical protein